MKKDILLDLLASRILDLPADKPQIVGIDGFDASGKTTLADSLADRVRQHRPVLCASIDGFHLPRDTRYRKGELSPAGYYYDSFNYKEIINKLLLPWKNYARENIYTTIYDFRKDRAHYCKSRIPGKEAILIFEGVFLLRRELIPFWDLKIFLEVDFTVVLERALKRDQKLSGSSTQIRKKYEMRYINGQIIYLHEADPLSKADFIVNNNDPDNPNLILNNEPSPKS
ncbi:MAG: hypothetical protein JXB60_09965 [Candidatus Cloacimonetes bacterium]|nr:hypothetical protein [Candidatus Cloacimonadota bacterium]